MKMLTKSKQAGFTLLEILVVVGIVGFLVAMFAPATTGGNNKAKATNLIRAADQINGLFASLTRECNVPTTITGNLLPDTGKTLSDVLFAGASNLNSNYTACWNSAGAKALPEVGQPTSTTGVYSVRGYTVTFTGGGSGPILINFLAVPDEIGLQMVRTYYPNLSALGTSDASSDTIRYTALSSGTRTVSVVKLP